MTITSSLNPWVTCPKPNPHAHLRLFCFPYAGGGASIFREWLDILAPEIEIYPIRLPGREGRLLEPPFTELSPLVQELAQVLQPYLHPPFAFFGHSLGALISFELARHLRRRNNPMPIHLFISGCRAPQIPDSEPPIHLLTEVEFVNELRRFNGTTEEILQNTELMQLMLPLLRADFTIYETYVHITEDPLACPISAFGGLQDHKVSYNDMRAWRDQTSNIFMLRMLPGDHFFLHSARVLLLRAISQDLIPTI